MTETLTYDSAMATHALQQSSSRERRATLGFLIAATVIGVVCAFGPIWMVRVGLAVALLGAAASVWYSFKEISRIEILHRSELKAVRDRAAEAARQHHTESMELIDTFTQRYKAHGEQLGNLREELASRQQELSTLRGNLVSTQAEADRRAERITELEALLEATEAKLNQNVVTLPRRPGPLPTAAELWSDGNHPTLVDVALLRMPELPERKRA